MKDKVLAAMKDAMKNREAKRLGVLRMMKAEIDEVETREGRVDAEAVVFGYAKTLKKAIDEYEKLNQAERASELKDELAVVEEFLPKALSPEETAAVIDEILAEGEFGPKDIGRVMKELMGRCGKRVDGKTAQSLVREKLNG